MDRLRCLLVAVALAVAMSVVAAGPALAAKGGNSDNAHACQQGGHQNMFEAETGNPFKNAGDCTSHGARGGASSSLVLTTPVYACQTNPMASCWGAISGSGLNPERLWLVFVTGGSELIVKEGFPAQDGSLATLLQVQCAAHSLQPLQAMAVTAGDQPSDITSTPVNSPCH